MNAIQSQSQPKQGAGLVVQEWPIDRLVPYARNPRKNDTHVDQMVAAIKEFGFRIPIVARSDGTVVDGHLRLKAGQKLGLQTVPVALADELSEAQVKAFRILANKSTSWAEWDNELLALEFEDLKGMDYDLTLTGFDIDELAEFDFSPEELAVADPEDTPAVQERAVSVPGDVWLLGKHRLMCGDSTDAVAVSRLLDGATPHLMVTDPPYGVNYDPAWRERVFGAGGRATGTVQNDGNADWKEAFVLFPGDVAYCWSPHGNIQFDFYRNLLEAGFEVREQLVWNKNNFAISRGNYHPKHEICWYAVRNGKTAHWTGKRDQTTVWDIDRNRKNESGHGTQKPLECMSRPIENNSLPGDAVYEPFSGSGTTIVACETLGRVCYAMEIFPAYVDVAVRRWQEFTRKAAVLEGTAMTFADVQADRLGEQGN